MKDTKINELYHESTENMSKRFYAACKAMQGILSEGMPAKGYEYEVAQMAYAIADEMLKQENQLS